MLLLKAFALVRFHFFSAAAVFDEIDVRVLFLFSMEADPLRKHESKIRRILVTMKLEFFRLIQKAFLLMMFS